MTRRMRLAGWFLTAAAIAIVFQADVEAAAGDLYIKELMAGANGDSRVQFLVIAHPPGENLWGPQSGESESRAMLVFYDGAGRESGKFKFPVSPAARAGQQTLIATREFANLPNAPVPDVLIPPLLVPVAGKVCFKNNPANRLAEARNECVSYGGFRGEPEINRTAEGIMVPAGRPAPELPILNAVSLRRGSDSRRNSDFRLVTRAAAGIVPGESFVIPVASAVEQGANLFNNETFLGNGRTCATCHIATDSLRLSPANIQARFATLSSPTFSFDPLFVGESKPSSFDPGFDFNLNTLVLSAPVATAAPCTGELRGGITTANGGRGKVLARISGTTYLVYGGMNPMMSGEVTDGICSGTVGSMTAGDLAVAPGSTARGLEDPRMMRTSANSVTFPQGRGLILENIDGFANPPVFRKSPHLLNLARTGPFGFSGDVADLQSFVTIAVQQHFPRTLARNASGANPDFRLPTADESAAIAAFLQAQEFPAGSDPNKFDLDRFATTSAQRTGRAQFFGTPAQPNCSICHGGPTLSQTTLPIQGKPAGVNAAFNTGTANLVTGDNVGCEPGAPASGPCNSREFSVPPLFNLPNLGPFFHHAATPSVGGAVNFYFSSQFASSPANAALVAQGLNISVGGQIASFLSGLTARPYSLSAGPIRFGAQGVSSGATAAQSITITNTSASSLTFSSTACSLTGVDASQFVISSCPLTTLAAGQSATILVAFDPGAAGLKSATLEVNATIPSGVDLFGVGDALSAPPTLTGITGASGTAAGGDSVTLSGTNFVSGATLDIGGVRAGFVKVESATSITARTGPHAAGAVDVVVINPDGQQATRVNGFTYTAALPLSLSAIAPLSGSSLGSSVTINGSGFAGGAAVTFAGVPARLVDVATSTSLTATTPAHAPGPVDVCVINLDGAQVCAPNMYTYSSAPSPLATSLSPASGSYLGGTAVTIQGSNFAPGMTVSLGGSLAAINSVSPTTIRVTTSAHAVGVVNVVLTNPDGQATTLTNGFTFLPPAITTVSPAGGANAGGTAVTISGFGFLTGASVTFGGTPATSVAVSGQTLISVVTPSHAAGPVDVVVTNPDGQTATKTNGFNFILPSITSLSPSTGSTVGDTRVTILGSGFGPGASVTFGGVPGTAVTSTESSIGVTAPPHAVGPVDVVVTTATFATAVSVNGFVYVLPSITSMSPISGTTSGNTTVSISGSGFGAGAAVTFGGSPATVTSAGETSISARTPAHAAGLVDVVVTNVNGTSTTRVNGFNFVGPSITSINPARGNTGGGISISINGAGFAQGATVTFGGLPATVSSASETFLSVTAPPHAVGLVAVVVTNPNGSSISAGFTYVPPAITSVSPSSGGAAGGKSVTVNGSGFSQGVSVTFGGAAATNVSLFNSDTSISLTTPAHAAGPVDVVVTNPNGLTASLASAFTYLLPAITSVSPSSGPSGGGTQVTLSGSGFAQTATVTIGGVIAPRFSGFDDTSLTVTAPPHAPGLADIVLTNPNGDSVTRSNAFTYLASAITSVAPTSGTTAGGTSVTINGTGFSSSATVLFGGVPAIGVFVNGGSTIFMNSPPHAAGAVDIVVNNSNGVSVTRSNAFTYVGPAITTISPLTGNTNGGTELRINGSSFAPGSTVKVGGVPATSVAFNGDTQLVAITPRSLSGAAGPLDVMVIGPDGTSVTKSAVFTYVLPSINAITPVSGSSGGGTNVSITGSGFARSAKVTIGGVPATNISGIDTALTATVPAHAPGAVDIIVSNPDGNTATRAGAFTYVTPSITSLSPASGSVLGGTSVQISGAGFAAGVTVRFGGVAATNVSVSSESFISLRTPAHAAGSVDVVVTSADGSSTTKTNGFTYLLPSITTLSTTAGNTGGGTFVQIQGSGFGQGSTVTFGGAAATISSSSETSLFVRTPPHVPGAVDVVVTTPGAGSVTRFSAFTYIPPSIISLGATSGGTGGGKFMSISGIGFSPGATVKFGGVPATGVSADDTFISLTTPPHAAGIVDVVVTNPDGGSVTLSNAFTYFPPSITSLSPTSGSSSGGTFVSIFGQGFASGTGVTFGGIAATVFGVFETSISVETPPHAIGAVDVVLTNPDGTVLTAANAFNYVPSVTISSLSTPSGSSLGGTALSINGTGFLVGATVKIGGVAASNVAFVNSTLLTAITGPHAPGAADVVVTNPNGSAGTLINGFLYIAAAPPQVSGINPPSGPSHGGTLVTISGSAFVAGATVKIGGSAATGVTFVNSSLLTATTGPHAAGLNDVVVANVDTQSGTLAAAFEYLPGSAPSVSSILPSSGSTRGGTSVTIIGSGFASGASVNIAGQPATNVTVLNPTTLVATTAGGAAGVWDVVVTNADGLSITLVQAFTLISTVSNDNFANRSLILGSGSITVTGSSVDATVEIGEPSDLIGAGGGSPSVWWTWIPTCSFTVTSPASFISTSGSSFDTVLGVFTGSSLVSIVPFASDDDSGGNLTSLVPSATPGPGVVNIVAGTAYQIRVRGFGPNSMGTIKLHIDSPCGISGVVPASGPHTGGTAVSIVGSGFTNESRVAFGGVNAASLNVLSSTLITATTAPHGSGAVEVTVTTPGQPSATVPNAFTFIGGGRRVGGQITSQ